MTTNEPAKTTNRYCYAKEYRRPAGGFSWGVYDNTTKSFVEGGFFSMSAAREAAATWNAERS